MVNIYLRCKIDGLFKYTYANIINDSNYHEMPVHVLCFTIKHLNIGQIYQGSSEKTPGKFQSQKSFINSCCFIRYKICCCDKKKKKHVHTQKKKKTDLTFPSCHRSYLLGSKIGTTYQYQRNHIEIGLCLLKKQ